MLGGVTTSLLTIAVLCLIEKWFDFDLFSLTMWFVIPAGALLSGAVASSGYYLGAKQFQAKPTRVLAIGMVLVAGFTQLGLYYARYSLATTNDGRSISEIIDFGTFVKFVLTHARYGVRVHSAQIGDGVEVGAFGYLIAVLQFAAILSGGVIVYFMLASRPYCDGCTRYARTVQTRTFQFSEDVAEKILVLFRQHPVLSSRYWAQLNEARTIGPRAIRVEVLQCPTCQRFAVVESVQKQENGKWTAVHGFDRTAWAPATSTDVTLAPEPAL